MQSAAIGDVMVQMLCACGRQAPEDHDHQRQGAPVFVPCNQQPVVMSWWRCSVPVAGKHQKITITNDKGRLSKEEIERMVQVSMIGVPYWCVLHWAKLDGMHSSWA